MKKLIFPILLTFLFILEGQIVTIWNADLYSNGNIFVPRFLIIALLFYATYCNQTVAIYYSILFGLLFDITYTEVIGVYSFGFPVIVFLINQLVKILQSHVLILSFLSLCGIVLLEYYVYFLFILVNVTDMTHAIFFHNRLIPTLIINGIFIIITCFFLQKLFLYLQQKEEE